MGAYQDQAFNADTTGFILSVVRVRGRREPIEGSEGFRDCARFEDERVSKLMERRESEVGGRSSCP